MSTIHDTVSPPVPARSPADPRNPSFAPQSWGPRGSTFLSVLLTLARRKKFILLVTVGCAAAALIVSLLLPPEYTATAVILPPSQSSGVASLAGDLGGLSSLAGLASSALGMKNLTDMYVSMLKSESVEDEVIRRYGLLAEYHKKYFYDARKRLEWHTTIDGSKKDGLIRLSFEDRSPARAAEVANGYVEVLRGLSQHLAITEAAQRRVVFENQLEQTKDDLTRSEEALKQTELSTGFVAIDSQARALIESAARLRAQVVAKEVQIEAMKAYAGEGNPELLEQQDALNSLRGQFDRLVGSSGSSADDLFLSKGNVPQAALEYARKLRDVKYNEAIFQVLARQLEAARIDEAKEGGFLQVVNQAIVPERRSFPKRAWITLGAAAFGLSMAVVLSLLEVRLARMRADPVEAEQLAALKAAASWRSQVNPAAHSGASSP